MSSELIGLVIAALGAIMTVAVAVGLPALAIVAVRFFKFKERELMLDMEYRQKSQQQDFAIEERLQHIESALQDVRVRLGIDETATPLASRLDLLEGPAVPEAQRGKSLDPSRIG